MKIRQYQGQLPELKNNVDRRLMRKNDFKLVYFLVKNIEIKENSQKASIGKFLNFNWVEDIKKLSEPKKGRFD